MDSPWRIELFGGLRLVRSGEATISRFQTRKTAALLAYLAYHRGKPTSREVLADLLWPDNDPEASRNSLRVALNSLRRQLEPPGIPSGAVLMADRAQVGLNSAAFVTDVLEFEAALREEREAAADEARATAALVRAVDLYRGPLLIGWYEEWVDLEQARFSEVYAQALRRLTTLLFQSGDYDRALDYARRAVHADPLREEIHRLLMRLYAATGRPSAAREQYERLESLLHEQMDAVPSGATRELLKQIMAAPNLSAGEADLPLHSTGPEHVAGAQDQATFEGDTTDVPAAALAASVGSIPLQFTRFFGRTDDVRRLVTLLAPAAKTNASAEARLVTLTGPGGTGKTRLAVEVAARLQKEGYAGRAWVVLLADLTEESQVGPAILATLRVLPEPNVAPLEQMGEALRGGPALLVLDNVEQIADAIADWSGELLSSLPALTILVTSRQRLGVSGEVEFPVAPLATPGGVSGRTTAPPPVTSPEQLLAFPSAALFLDRAQSVRPDFQITDRNAAAIAELCCRLDGLPLALELAAAWIRILSPAQMVARLAERYDLLVSERRDLTPRHRSLRAVVEESCRLLPDDLRDFFALLSVFRGGWTLDAAQAVCCYTPDQDALEMLDALQKRSLITIAPERVGDSVRFRVLETIRQYAESLVTPDAVGALRRGHFDFFAGMARRAALPMGAQEVDEGRDRLEADRDNLRAAIAFACENDPPAALRLVTALWRFWYSRGHATEGFQIVEQVLAVLPEGTTTSPLERAAGLHAAGRFALSLGNASGASSRFSHSLRILRDYVGERSATWQEATAIVAADLGIAAQARGDFATARDAYRVLAQEYHAADDRWAEAIATATLGSMHNALGETEEAARCFAESAALQSRTGDSGALADLLEQTAARSDGEDGEKNLLASFLYLGHIASAQGDYAAAVPLFREALAGFRRIDDNSGIALALERIALAMLRQGDARAARAAAEEAQLIRAERPPAESEAQNRFLGRIFARIDAISVSADDYFGF